MIYYQCTNCNQIESDSDWIVEGGNKVCKHCKANNQLELWPSTEIRELFETTIKYDHASFEYGLISSVFISAALELLLERLLFTMAMKNLLYEEVTHLIEPLLDTNQGRTKRLQLYKQLGDGPFDKESTEVGYHEFPKHWNEIAEIRNRSVHGSIEEGKRLTSSVVKTTIYEALAVFSRLHNKYNTKSVHFDVATERVKGLEKDLEKLRVWSGRVAADSELGEG
jgi:hypothetical protein